MRFNGGISNFFCFFFNLKCRMLNNSFRNPDRGAPGSVDPYCLVLENSSWVSAAAVLGPGAVVPAALSS